jgi:hypothetical protein
MSVMGGDSTLRIFDLESNHRNMLIYLCNASSYVIIIKWNFVITDVIYVVFIIVISRPTICVRGAKNLIMFWESILLYL